VALQQLGRDTVEAVVWPMSEAAAVLLDRSLRLANMISHHLRRREARRVHAGERRPGRLLASLADIGQQVPIVVVAVEDQADRYVVIDGYKRIVALQQLGRDTVEAVVWPMSEAAAVLLDRSLRLCEHDKW
jgi:ParB-like chromosome segregation protein Spo0J